MNSHHMNTNSSYIIKGLQIYGAKQPSSVLLMKILQQVAEFLLHSFRSIRPWAERRAALGGVVAPNPALPACARRACVCVITLEHTPHYRHQGNRSQQAPIKQEGERQRLT